MVADGAEQPGAQFLRRRQLALWLGEVGLDRLEGKVLRRLLVGAKAPGLVHEHGVVLANQPKGLALDVVPNLADKAHPNYIVPPSGRRV